jgi:hypothetical protein
MEVGLKIKLGLLDVVVIQLNKSSKVNILNKLIGVGSHMRRA